MKLTGIINTYVALIKKDAYSLEDIPFKEIKQQVKEKLDEDTQKDKE